MKTYNLRASEGAAAAMDSAKKRRGFTPAQQGLFRPLVEQAWRAHRQRFARTTSTAALFPSEAKAEHKAEQAAFRKWYEDELESCTGNRTTADCDRRRDFETLMAHFEQIVGDSIYWTQRVYGADARRVAWNIQEICRANEVDEDYMRGIARRMLRLDETAPLPALEQMTYQQLVIIMGELKRFLRRGGRPGVKQAGEEPW
jgi:hypothetical protein